MGGKFTLPRNRPFLYFFPLDGSKTISGISLFLASSFALLDIVNVLCVFCEEHRERNTVIQLQTWTQVLLTATSSVLPLFESRWLSFWRMVFADWSVWFGAERWLVRQVINLQPQVAAIATKTHWKIPRNNELKLYPNRLIFCRVQDRVLSNQCCRYRLCLQCRKQDIKISKSVTCSNKSRDLNLNAPDRRVPFPG